MSPTTVGVVNGTEDLSRWSDAELERGQKRDKNGRWPTKKPTIVARAVHDELVRRKMSRAYDLLRTNVYKAVEVLVSIATDKRADKAIRVKAATEILDRTLGKPTESMKLDIQGEWASIVARAIVPIAGDVIEGEVIDPEPDEPERTGKELRREAKRFQ